MSFYKTIMVNRCVKKRYKIMINEKKAKLYCKEDISLIENYEEAVNDPINKWVCHHRRGTIYSREGLKEIGEYYHRPACELIFMTEEEHKRFHKTGKRHSEETKKKLSEAMIGKKNHLGKHHSEKAKQKMSKAKMGNHNSPTKPILQYSKEGGFIREWVGASEASRVLCIHQGDITRCCQGKRNYAGGFAWRYR